MKNGSGFDNLDEISAGPDDFRKGDDSAAVKQRREKLEQQFVKVPVPWLNTLAKTERLATWPVALHLLRLSWKKNSNTVNLSNSGPKEWGIDRRQKSQALQELTAKKLVRVEGSERKSPRVTLLLTNSSQS